MIKKIIGIALILSMTSAYPQPNKTKKIIKKPGNTTSSVPNSKVTGAISTGAVQNSICTTVNGNELKKGDPAFDACWKRTHDVVK